jgi:hypothetical protein
MKLLMDSVIRLYGHLTDEEVKNAFNLLIAGEFEVENHYQSFSAKYFSDVVKRYLNYATKILRDIPEEPKQEIKELPMSDEDFINDRFVDWFSMKNKKYSFIDVTLFDKLRKKGFLKLSQEEKTKIKKDVMIDMALLEESKEFKDIQTKLEILRSDQSKEDYIQELCKKYVVAQFFNELIKQEKLKVL